MSRFLSVLFLLFVSFQGKSQSESSDYSGIFTEGFSKASNYLIENKWMYDTLKRRGVDPCIALSVVFPELLRYKQLQDKIEVTALKTLYIQYGSTYSDFSIGHFQMKPSFAEAVEKEWNGLSPKQECFQNFIFDVSQTKENRIMRIHRLDNEQGQLFYLTLFYFIIEQKSVAQVKTDAEKVLFYSTAYNFGFCNSFDKIKAHMGIKEFHTDIFKTKKTTCYSYADIAIYFYQIFKKNYHK